MSTASTSRTYRALRAKRAAAATSTATTTTTSRSERAFARPSATALAGAGGATRIVHLRAPRPGAPDESGGGVVAVEVASGTGGAAAFRNPLAPVMPDRILLPVVGEDDELPPAFERTLAPIAERAWSGDRAARDALYAAFEPKLMRFARGIHVPFAPAGSSAIWDRDDVRQEAYLAFLDVIASWTPPIPFGRYVFAHFPWRLRDVVYRGVGRPAVPFRLAPVEGEQVDMLGDDSAAAAEARIMLESLASSFDPPYDDILRWHIGEGESMLTVAGRLGCSRRTVTRRWRELLGLLRAELAEP